jgi:methionine--tRNA ligase beta chain
MSNEANKFYLTTPIYYVNARPHIGHAYTTIVADVLARRHRLLGEDTFFLTGTDEHGQKIERSASAAGIPPQLFADQVSKSFEDLWKRMGITNDAFIRTTDPRHIQGAQKLFADLYARGQIYLSSYTGQYSIGEEMFVEGPPGTIGPDGRPTETVTEENFFFRLSDYQLPLLDLIESGELVITPDSSRNEVLAFLRGDIRDREGIKLRKARERLNVNKAGLSTSQQIELLQTAELPDSQIGWSHEGEPFLKGALRDLSVSRSSFTWGIPVSDDILREAGTTQKHVIYVWLDALANYMTAIGYGSDSPAERKKFEHYWPADLHLVGKEITRFHCVYWPAFLLALNPALRASTQTSTDLSSRPSTDLSSRPSTDLSSRPSTDLSSRPPTDLSSRPEQDSSIVLRSGETRSSAPPQLSMEEHQARAKEWLPKQITAHGWLLFDNSKMSKSKGNIVRTETILDAFGTLCPPIPLSPPQDMSPATDRRGTASAVPSTTPEPAALAAEVRPPTRPERDLFASDILRYYLLREIPFGQDGSFSFDALITRYNADLANGYGNLVSRTLGLIQQNFEEGLLKPSSPWLCPDRDVYRAGNEPRPPFEDRSGTHFIMTQVSNYVTFAADHYWPDNRYQILLAELMLRVSHIDAYISYHKPWLLAKATDDNSRKKLIEVLYTATEAIRIITALLYPILPYATARVWSQLGLGDIELAARNGDLTNLQWGGLKPGTKLGPLSPIFPRADKGLAQIMNDMEEQNAASPRETKLTTELDPTQPITNDPSHPGAPPRTSSMNSLAEPSRPLPVGGSRALSTGPQPTPSHTEIPASGIFANQPVGATAPATGNQQSTSSNQQPASDNLQQAIDNQQPATAQINIDDFAKIELRVAQILVAERIPKADKLLRLEVDLGYEKRQILSGIAEFYTPEELIGRRIVVITNLAPRKMRGLESHGMLLAASADMADGKPGKPILATMAEEIALGSRLK